MAQFPKNHPGIKENIRHVPAVVGGALFQGLHKKRQGSPGIVFSQAVLSFVHDSLQRFHPSFLPLKYKLPRPSATFPKAEKG